MVDYTLTMSKDQTKVVQDALETYMAINSGNLESLLDAPFVRRELPKGFYKEDSITHAKRFITEIKTGLIQLSNSNEQSIYDDYPVGFLTHGFVEGQFHLTDRQGDFLIRALDCYTRFNIGHLEILFEQPYIHERLPRSDHQAFTALEGCLGDVKILMGLPRFGSHGIGHPDCVEARQAFDILCVVRHRLSWDRAGNPKRRTAEMFGVYYNEPFHWHKEWPLPTMIKRT